MMRMVRHKIIKHVSIDLLVWSSYPFDCKYIFNILTIDNMIVLSIDMLNDPEFITFILLSKQNRLYSYIVWLIIKILSGPLYFVIISKLF